MSPWSYKGAGALLIGRLEKPLKNTKSAWEAHLLTLLAPQSHMWGQSTQIVSSLSPKTGLLVLKGLTVNRSTREKEGHTWNETLYVVPVSIFCINKLQQRYSTKIAVDRH